jgi:hypothetical protein
MSLYRPPTDELNHELKKQYFYVENRPVRDQMGNHFDLIPVNQVITDYLNSGNMKRLNGPFQEIELNGTKFIFMIVDSNWQTVENYLIEFNQITKIWRIIMSPNPYFGGKILPCEQYINEIRASIIGILPLMRNSKLMCQYQNFRATVEVIDLTLKKLYGPINSLYNNDNSYKNRLIDFTELSNHDPIDPTVIKLINKISNFSRINLPSIVESKGHRAMYLGEYRDRIDFSQPLENQIYNRAYQYFAIYDKNLNNLQFVCLSYYIRNNNNPSHHKEGLHIYSVRPQDSSKIATILALIGHDENIALIQNNWVKLRKLYHSQFSQYLCSQQKLNSNDHMFRDFHRELIDPSVFTDRG